MKTRLGLVIAALSIVTMANSANALPTTTIGDRTCGSWSSRKENPYTKMIMESWLAGFMTGMAAGASKDVLADTDADSMFLWIDNYCQAHPLDRVSTGAVSLFLELLGRRKQ